MNTTRWLLLASLLLPVASQAAGSCCAAERAPEPPKPDACCAAMDTAAKKLSAHSLYQLDATFVDDSGHPVRLAELRGRPVLLTMFFSHCKMACPALVSDLTRIRSLLPEGQRDNVQIVLVSFDVERDTVAALAEFRQDRTLGNEWRLMRGDAEAVSELAALLGVKYRREADGAFAHSNLITVLNAAGEIVHQRNGLTGGLEDAARAVATAN
ncbi:SCO family protein [Nibricoccus sp. IMCC34717]|uniref:SCO family protein n=1 Tax=Nibricoccus sp. IMCC34717 TaxID=3034021 RepID=UPI003850ACC9